MKVKITLLLFMFIQAIKLEAQINGYTKPIENTLEEHVSPSMANQFLAMKIKSDQLTAEAKSYQQYYKLIESFKPVIDGRFKTVVVIAESLKGEGYATITEGKISKLEFNKTYDLKNGLMVPSKVSNAHSKVFLNLENRMTPIDIYIPELYN